MNCTLNELLVENIITARIEYHEDTQSGVAYRIAKKEGLIVSRQFEKLI